MRGELGRGKISDVHDGDTVKVGNNPRGMRLRGIDAPELFQPYGEESRDALAGMIPHRSPGDSRPNIYFKPYGYDYYGQEKVKNNGGKSNGTERIVVDLLSDEPDISRAAKINMLMVIGGHAWGDSYAKTHLREQAQAKAAKKGLWKDPNPEHPYKARQRKNQGK